MKKCLSLLPAVFLVLSGLVFLMPESAYAASNNDLIDDSTFDNTSSMTATQIDNWLNGFSGSCISPNSGFTAADPTGYSPDANFIDGHYSYGSRVTAGHVVYDAAVAHGVNPQVLLTKLENEENLVTGVSGCATWRYASAVGYGCTDSGSNTHNYTYTGADPYTNSSALVTPLYYHNGTAVNSISGSCVNQNVKAGFSEQVVHAAWLLSFSRHKSEGQTSFAEVHGGWNHCEDNDSCPAGDNIPASWACYSGYMTQGSYERCPTDSSPTFYDGYASIDGQTIHMDTGATAALYVYTPHIQSFDTIFTPWFGDPTSACESTANINGADSGRSIIASQYSSKGPTSLVFTRLNNTGSECTEYHVWASGYKSWAAHIITGMRATNPTDGELISGNFFGGHQDRLIYLRYSGSGGRTEVHMFSSNLQQYPGVYDVLTNLSDAGPSTGTFVAGDFLGRGYDQLLYVKFASASGFAEIHMLSKDLRDATGTYDVVTDLPDTTATNGTFVAGDFLHKGYAQLAYVKYSNGSGKAEIHIFDRSLKKVTGTYDVLTNLTGASATSGTFVAGDFLGRGYDQLVYVRYAGSSGKVEVHTFSPDLRTGVGYQDIATNMSSITPPL